VTVMRTCVTRLGLLPSLLESQTVCAANEATRAGRHHEAFATKVPKDRFGYSQLNHGSAPSLIGPLRRSPNQPVAFKNFNNRLGLHAFRAATLAWAASDEQTENPTLN
jgi:hypothetical protein